MVGAASLPHGWEEGGAEAVSIGESHHGMSSLWLERCRILINSIAAAPLLTLPYGLSMLGWPGGLTTMLVAALAAAYGCILLARLYEVYGGAQTCTYHELAAAIVGAFLAPVASAGRCLPCLAEPCLPACLPACPPACPTYCNAGPCCAGSKYQRAAYWLVLVPQVNSGWWRPPFGVHLPISCSVWGSSIAHFTLHTSTGMSLLRAGYRDCRWYSWKPGACRAIAASYIPSLLRRSVLGMCRMAAVGFVPNCHCMPLTPLSRRIRV